MSSSPPRRRGLKDRLQNIAENLVQFAGSVGEVVSAAQELLTDQELRRKGANLIAQEAAKSINEVQRGFEAGAESLQQGAKARIGAGAQRLQAVLRNIERQIQEFQKQQQQRDLQAELEHHHKLPVDIQIGDQVFEDMPQEMRSRFWYVLLERPDLAQALTSKQLQWRTSRPGSAVPDASGSTTVADVQSSAAAAAGAAAGAAGVAAADQLSSSTEQQLEAAGSMHGVAMQQRTATAAADTVVDGVVSPALPGSPFAAYSSSPEPKGPKPAADAHTAALAESEAVPAAVAAAAAAEEDVPGEVIAEPVHEKSLVLDDNAPDIDDLLTLQSASGPEQIVAGADSSSSVSAGCSGNGGHCEGTAAAAARQPSAPNPWEAAHCPSGTAASIHHSSNDSSSSSQSSASTNPSAPNPWGPVAAAAGSSVSSSSGSGSRSSTGQAAAAAAAAPAVTAAGSLGEGDGWEMVSRDVPVPHSLPGSSGGAAGEKETLDSLRTLVESLTQDVDAARAAQAAVFQAMLEVPWLPGEGIPQEYDAQGEYAQLLEAGCGHVEDIILRDVPRTFPEHPLFSSQAGQQRLLRLLKAYAAVDPEVGYCQGMAFTAGILLMYLPEEPAFRLYKRIMMSGPELRRLYLPGLDFLKMSLSRFELLLASHHPQLHQHLLACGLPALLYAAQWLMTCYACPFPLHVAARVVDVLLQAEGDGLLMTLGLAVMSALEQQLLELDDFEELITLLKVKPLAWPLHTHRQVLDNALHSPATDAELDAAAAAVTAEYNRLGRFSSFSTSRLVARQCIAGSSGEQQQQQQQQHELVQEAAEAAGAAGDGRSSEQQAQQGLVEPAQAGTAASADLSALTGSLKQHVDDAQQQQQQQPGSESPSGAAAGSAEGVPGHFREDSGVLGELDATLLDLMKDMILPDSSDDEGHSHQG